MLRHAVRPSASALHSPRALVLSGIRSPNTLSESLERSVLVARLLLKAGQWRVA